MELVWHNLSTPLFPYSEEIKAFRTDETDNSHSSNRKVIDNSKQFPPSGNSSRPDYSKVWI